MPFTWLDIALFAVMVLSGLLAMMRGFSREVLSIVSWVAAAAAAAAVWFHFPDLKEIARNYIQPDYLADIVLTAVAFVLVLVIVSALTAKLSDRILQSEAGALDRTMGFIFGVGRGLILVVIAFLLFDWLVPRDRNPSWVRHARTMPIIDKTADYIVSYLPKDIAETLRRPGSGTKKKGDGRNDPAGTQPAPSPDQRDTTYKNREREGLNQLVEGSSGPKN